MKQVESFIKEKAPGALYGEWAKKEECWNELKRQKFNVDFTRLKSDFEDPKNPSQRKRIADEESTLNQIEEELEKLRSIPPEIWHRIEKWGRATGELSEQKKTVVFNMAGRVRNNTKISDYERQTAMAILDVVVTKVPELLDGIDEINEQLKNTKVEKPDISIETIQKLVQWDKKNKKLRNGEFTFLLELSRGNKPLNERNKSIALSNLSKAKRLGFKEV
jgi:hypothetical protein